MREPPDCPGADAVVAWWGSWIAFHDFYLLSLPGEGAPEDEARVHGWMTDRSKTDYRGCFLQTDDCVVRLLLSEIQSVELSSRELPAILFTLSIDGEPGDWSVEWDSSFGCEGRIRAGSLRIALEPGRPDR